MKTQIKLCGFKHIEDINYASSLDIDYLGMIFVKNLPRSIDINVAHNATKICKDNNVKTVGVFLNQKATEISEVLKSVDLDVIQLHGNENISDYYELNKPIIKRMSISDYRANVPIINTHRECMYLIDTSNEKMHGGTGQSFDWNLLGGDVNPETLFIAGGLKPDNILELLTLCTPMCVDVSSGIEYEVGHKDPTLMSEFVNKVRIYNEEQN
tara:strand:+ start:58 stop:693 length:636 start_codon:yes stop_codon:yes gene_type:complete